MAGAATIGPGINTHYPGNVGFHKLRNAIQQGEEARAGAGVPTESSQLSGRAQREALLDRTAQNWRELRIPESKPLNQSEQRLMGNLEYMGGVAKKDGGGYKTFADGREQITDTKGAFNHLRNGGQVNYYESAGDEPVALRSYSQVSEAAKDLRTRQAATQAARD